MNILILSASTGGGHMRASRAIEKYMCEHDRNVDVKIIDTIEYISPIINKTVTNGYVYLATKTPKIYGKIYELTNKEPRWSNFVYRLNYLFANKILPLLEEFKPDIIITTHPFPTEMISILKNKEIINIPLICVMTDYAPHKTWINEKVDSYIVANDDMVEPMVKLGVSREKIHPYGIPIEEIFFQEKNRKSLMEELELDPLLPTVLMMAGSFGVTNIFEIYKDISSIERDFQIIVITGRNEKLYNDFEKVVAKSSKHTKLIFFTNEVSKFMQASDMIITKPGGLTITEALACNIPMAIFNAIPGQEEENADFLINHNMAIKLEAKRGYKTILEELLCDATKLSDMKNACRSFDKNSSAERISSLIVRLIDQYNE